MTMAATEAEPEYDPFRHPYYIFLRTAPWLVGIALTVAALVQLSTLVR